MGKSETQLIKMPEPHQRKIIHIDADAFYASVELRENPSLKGKPIAVGGKPNGRGVIATCDYLARQYGVHSAMPSSRAQRLCPDLVFVRPNFPLYKEVSAQIRAIMARYTDLIEPLSLDEAYLDVSESTHYQGSATLIAEAIKQSVKSELGIVVSAGVAPNKFLAKVASDWNKPDGLFVIKPEDVPGFVRDLPVKKINGVGKVTTKKLNDLGIVTCGDLQGFELTTLEQHFGKYGKSLYHYARGRDERPVQLSRERKSLSVEHTYDSDIKDAEHILEKANALYEDLVHRSEKLPEKTTINKRYVKIKFADFNQTTLEEKIPSYEQDWKDRAAFLRLIEHAKRRAQKPIRLMGMGIRIHHPKSTANLKQLELF